MAEKEGGSDALYARISDAREYEGRKPKERERGRDAVWLQFVGGTSALWITQDNEQ